MQGRTTSIAAADPEQTRTSVTTQLGDANIAPGGITLGVLKDGARAGKLLMEMHKISGTAQSVYKVPHTLGVVPAGVILFRTQNTSTPNTCLSVNTYNVDKWTATEVQVYVFANVGSVQGAEIWVYVMGQGA